MKRLLAALALLLLAAAPAWAQAPVQQVPSRLDACTLTSTSATSAATITITPPGGNFVYICGVDIANCAGTTVTAAAPTNVTTTGISGSPAYTMGSTSTAGICNPSPVGVWAAPLKSSTAGTAVTFVLPTFVTQQTIRVTVYYYYAP